MDCTLHIAGWIALGIAGNLQHKVVVDCAGASGERVQAMECRARAAIAERQLPAADIVAEGRGAKLRGRKDGRDCHMLFPSESHCNSR